jgi:hypothetical protein
MMRYAMRGVPFSEGFYQEMVIRFATSSISVIGVGGVSGSSQATSVIA